MKKVFSLILAIILAASCCCFAFAETPTVVLSATSATACKNGCVAITVGFSSGELTGYNAKVTYDTAKLEYVGYLTGNAFGFISCNKPVDGTVKIASIGSAAVSGPAEVATLYFKDLTGTAGSADVTLQAVDMLDADDNSVESPISNVIGTITVTDVKLGDVNGDGKVNSADARWTLQTSAGLRTLSGVTASQADVNCDGKVNSADARWILQVSAGLRTL